MVYLDIRMPGLAGLEVLKLIHADNPTIPVVLFTAQPDINSALEALRSGATDYLLKPLKPEAFIERTKAILEVQQKKQRKRAIQVQIDTLQAELRDIDAEEPIPSSSSKMPASSERYLKRGSLVLDLHARRLTVDENLCDLPPTSFDYLLVLARHAPEVVDYQTLVAEAQGFQAEPHEAREISKYHIHLIREAVEPDENKPTYLFNVSGTGYRLLSD
jgi:DNA-binding response OmpR family regulator